MFIDFYECRRLIRITVRKTSMMWPLSHSNTVVPEHYCYVSSMDNFGLDGMDNWYRQLWQLLKVWTILATHLT